MIYMNYIFFLDHTIPTNRKIHNYRNIRKNIYLSSHFLNSLKFCSKMGVVRHAH